MHHTEALQRFLENCTFQAVQSKASSESRYAKVQRELGDLRQKEAEATRLLKAQTIQTRKAAEKVVRLEFKMEEIECCNTEAATKVLRAETEVDALGAILEKACRKLDVFVAGIGKGNVALAEEVARLIEKLKNATVQLELERANTELAVAAKEKLATMLAGKLAQLAADLKLAQDSAGNANKEKEVCLGGLGGLGAVRVGEKEATQTRVYGCVYGLI